MRTISTIDSKRLAAGASRRLVRVSVQDQGGTWRDLSTYPGFNAVRAVSWKEDIDSVGMSADIKLARAQEALSLSPLAGSSALNKTWNPAGSLNTLLGLGRGVKIEWGFAPDDDRLAPDAWHLAFQGQIDSIDWPEDEVALACRGQEAPLLDTFVEHERVYAYCQGANATKGAFIFETGRAYSVGDLVVPSQAAVNGHFYKCTTAGTTNATTEPSWPTGGSSTVTSGTATFTEQGATSDTAGTAVETVLQQIISDHVSSPPTLYVPTSPAWSIRYYQQQRQSVWEAVRALVTQIGWDIRFQWDNGTSAFRLTLIQPDRTKAFDDRAFGAGTVMAVSQCEQKIDDIRNAVRVVYSDSQDRDANGEPKRKTLDVTDSPSIASYGRRFMEIAEGSSSNIDSSSEATTLANAALSDLSTPVLNFSPELELFPFAQLGDLYGFTHDGVHFDADQHLAVIGVEHSVDESSATTKLAVRGKPVGGIDRWLEQDTRAAGDVHLLTLIASTGQQATISEVIGGSIVVIKENVSKSAHSPEYEVHISSSPGFAPDDTTLVQRGGSKTAVITDLVPGTTYYQRHIPLVRNAQKIVRGLPSPEQSFVAGYLQGRHVFPFLDFRSYPLNGNFESPGDANPPDVWEASTGVFNTDWQLNTSAPTTGSRCLEMLGTAVGTRLASGWVPVREGFEYVLRWQLARVGGAIAGGPLVHESIEWFDKDLNGLSADTTFTDLSTVASEERRYTAVAPSTARWALVSFEKDADATVKCTIDGVVLEGPHDIWHGPSFNTGWGNIAGAYMTGAYTKDLVTGRVYLRGVVKRSSGVATRIFTLPADYRPAATLIFPLIADNVIARIDVQNDGQVILQAGTAVNFLSLDGVQFDQRN